MAADSVRTLIFTEFRELQHRCHDGIKSASGTLLLFSINLNDNIELRTKLNFEPTQVTVLFNTCFDTCLHGDYLK